MWIDLLKADSANNLNPAACDFMWEAFRRKLNDETFNLQDLCYSQVLENFTQYLKAFKT